MIAELIDLLKARDEQLKVASRAALQHEIEVLCYGGPGGTFCCPVCLSWYKTSDEKTRCLTDNHGYEILNVESKSNAVVS